MAPRLRVLAGTSASNMQPITDLINTGTPHIMRSSVFEGSVVAHIKGFTDEQSHVRDSEYFHRKDREGLTWSIQVQGRFLVPFSSDDILFGNTFDRPLKLPWGTSAVLKFMHYIDPTLEHELSSSTKPWALSPLVSTMPHLAHSRVPLLDSGDGSRDNPNRNGAKDAMPPFPPNESINDSTPDLYLALSDDSDDAASTSSGSSSGSINSKASALSSSSRTTASSRLSGKSWRRKKRELRWEEKVTELKSLGDSSKRRGYFASREKRKEIVFGPQDVITTDFCYGFINFAPSLSLQLPGGLSFDLMKYWDGQPVRFVCCQRKGSHPADNESSDPLEEDKETADDPWGRVFWCIAIEIADDDSS